jgi:Kef-type K+ transport system membrane component KefB
MRSLPWAGCAAGALAVLAAAPLAAAAEPATSASGASEAVFIVQIVLLLLVGRLLGEAMQRIGQPAIIGQLLAGIVLGPSIFGAVWPDAQHAIFPPQGEQRSMIDAVAQLGILMLLLLTGMETDLRLVKKVGAAASGISIAGIAVPFACGFALGELLPDGMLPNPDQRLVTSLFLGTALSISSVKIVALIVREMNFIRRNVGQIIVASAIIDDSLGWIIIAVTFGLASHGTVDLGTLARSVLGTALFLLVSLTIGRRIVFTLIRWTNDSFVSEVPVITMILIIMGGMALVTHLIGVHTVLGAFVAGILVGESPILTRHIDEQLRGLITALFAPVFFGLAGLGTDLSVFKTPQIRRRLHRRSARRLELSRVAGAGMRNERARVDRGHHRHHRAFHGGAEPKPLHGDRRHGGGHHRGNAADATLGAGAPAARGRGEKTPGPGGVRGAGIRDQHGAPADRRRRRRQRQVRLPPCRAHRRRQRHAHHACSRAGRRPTGGNAAAETGRPGARAAGGGAGGAPRRRGR